MPNNPKLDELLLLWEERRQQGRTTPAEELCRDCPELLAALRGRIRALKAVDAMLRPGVNTTDESTPFDTATSGGACPFVAGYEVMGELGRGGMGVVYKARQISLNRTVALKMILAGAHAGPSAVARFRAEAETLARLQHPNIVQIHEVGEQDRCPYFALEYVAGGRLSDRLDGTPQPPRQAAELLLTLAGAVQAAHRQGIVHRDLKPANVLLTVDGVPKIADFGLAKRLDPGADDTRSGSVLGTPSYMAPEQAAGRTHDIGPLADVYALGVILYELLTGRPPFRGATPLETLEQVRRQEPVPPTRLQPRCPRDLQTVCLKCLEKDPPRRYASAEAFADDLRRFLNGEPIQARPTPAWERAAKWARRRPAVAILSATVVAVAAVGLGLVLLQWQRAEQQWQRAEDRAGAEALARGRAQTEKENAERAERRSRLLTARMAVNEGLKACDAGDVDYGLLWLVRACDLAPDDEGLRRIILANVGGWGRQVFPFRGQVAHERAVYVAAFSPDGKLLVTGSNDETARLWDADTGEPVGEPMRHNNSVRQIAFRPDGRVLLTGCDDGTARFWDAKGRPLTAPLRHGESIKAVAFRRDGTLAMTAAGNGSVRLWQPDGTPVGEPLRIPGAVQTADFSPDGKTLVVGLLPDARAPNQGALFWDVATRRPVGQPLEHRGAVVAVAFTPDGRAIVTGSADATARVWEVPSGKPLTPPLPHQGPIAAVAFSPDGQRVATACGDGTARVWDVTGGQPLGPALRHPQRPINTAVLSVAFSPDGQLLLTAAGHSARLWESATGRPVGHPLRHALGVERAIFRPDGQAVLTASLDGTARAWGIVVTEPQARELHAPEPPRHAAASPDGRFVVLAGTDVTRWDARGEPLGRLCRPPGGAHRVAYSGDGSAVVTTGPGGVSVWDAESGKSLGPPIRPGSNPQYVFAYPFPDGRRLLVGWSSPVDSATRLFDAATGEGIGPASPYRGLVLAAAFSSDGRTVLTTGDGGLRLWDAGAGKPLDPPLPHPGAVRAVAVSPDGKALLTGGADGIARLWDATTRRPLGVPMRHGLGIDTLAFRPDGSGLLTGSADGTARLWDAAGVPLGEPLPHGAEVVTVAFGQEGRIFLTATRDRVRAWDTAHVLPLGPGWMRLQGTGITPAFVDGGRTILTSIGGKAVLVPVAEAPRAQDAEVLRQWAEVLTRHELDSAGGLRELDMSDWRQRGARLHDGDQPAR